MTKRMLIGYLQIGYLFWLPARQHGLHPNTLLSPRAISHFWKRALPFHEKAGRSQELLWFGKFISDVFLCPDIG